MSVRAAISARAPRARRQTEETVDQERERELEQLQQLADSMHTNVDVSEELQLGPPARLRASRSTTNGNLLTMNIIMTCAFALTALLLAAQTQRKSTPQRDPL